ncbi:hypothetical protein NPIL_235031 [Nephila pilipes]|uniref:Uncharacterized protein n=1 Tax=Nephila pilipes TaxID=299642 RepID=A0A8X6M6J1_NEPPI|nr:hypothetical protein NPIL_235031 [Nephila pilipes]
MESFGVPDKRRHLEWTIAWNLSTMVVDSHLVTGGGDISADHTEKEDAVHTQSVSHDAVSHPSPISFLFRCSAGTKQRGEQTSKATRIGFFDLWSSARKGCLQKRGGKSDQLILSHHRILICLLS